MAMPQANNHLHKTHRENRFATVNLNVIEDKRLSALAKALHFYAMSRPDDWTLSIADIENRFRECRDSIYKAFDQLEKCGYLKRTQDHSNAGRFGLTVYDWYEEAQPVEEVQKPPCEEIPDTVKPCTVSTDTVKPDTEIPYTLKSTTTIYQDNNTPEVQSTKIPAPLENETSGCYWCTFNNLTPTPLYRIVKTMHDEWNTANPVAKCPAFLIGRKAEQPVNELLRAGKSIKQICDTWRMWVNDKTAWERGKCMNLKKFVGSFEDLCERYAVVNKPAEQPTTTNSYVYDAPGSTAYANKREVWVEAQYASGSYPEGKDYRDAMSWLRTEYDRMQEEVNQNAAA